MKASCSLRWPLRRSMPASEALRARSPNTSVCAGPSSSRQSCPLLAADPLPLLPGGGMGCDGLPPRGPVGCRVLGCEMTLEEVLRLGAGGCGEVLMLGVGGCVLLP